MQTTCIYIKFQFRDLVCTGKWREMATPVGSDGAPVNRLNDISDRVRDDLFDIRWPTRVIPLLSSQVRTLNRSYCVRGRRRCCTDTGAPVRLIVVTFEGAWTKYHGDEIRSQTLFHSPFPLILEGEGEKKLELPAILARSKMHRQPYVYNLSFRFAIFAQIYRVVIRRSS